MTVRLRMSGRQHAELKAHLLPSDGKEAVALMLCGRHIGADADALLVRKIIPIPYEECTVREIDCISWPTTRLQQVLEEAMASNWSIVKIHSHPNGFSEFSGTDDASDRILFSSLHGWIPDVTHASAIMLQDGRIFARSVDNDGAFFPISLVSVAGDDLQFWFADDASTQIFEFSRRTNQLFGPGTTVRLRKLKIGVIGCSGTGSIVVEQLARLGVGKLVLVDPDTVEEKNLNRILNSTMEDARQGTPKVDVCRRAISAMELDTEVLTFQDNLCSPQVVKAVAGCDIVFGCMDGAEGRHVLNRLSTFYQIPYFDVGVRLDADGIGGIDQICGTVNYLQPDGSSLISRQVITLKEAGAEAMKRMNPEEYERQVQESYILGVQVDRPAVISVNAHYAGMAVCEFLARLHPYRDEENAPYARYGSSLTQSRIFNGADGEPCPVLSRHIGRGDVIPLLDMPLLSES